MRKDFTIRYLIAAVLLTAGCGLLLAGHSNGYIVLGSLSLVTMPRSEWTDPLPRREPWKLFAVLLAVIGVVVAGKALLTEAHHEALGRAVLHPLLVVPLWLLILCGLIRNWHRASKAACA